MGCQDLTKCSLARENIPSYVKNFDQNRSAIRNAIHFDLFNDVVSPKDPSFTEFMQALNPRYLCSSACFTGPRNSDDQNLLVPAAPSQSN